VDSGAAGVDDGIGGISRGGVEGHGGGGGDAGVVDHGVDDVLISGDLAHLERGNVIISAPALIIRGVSVSGLCGGAVMRNMHTHHNIVRGMHKVGMACTR
jgi:hypothetical protein